MTEPGKVFVQELLLHSDEYRQLQARHVDYERRLDALRGSPFLSADQEREVKDLKKKKLLVKDRMLELAQELRAR